MIEFGYKWRHVKIHVAHIGKQFSWSYQIDWRAPIFLHRDARTLTFDTAVAQATAEAKSAIDKLS